MAEAKATRVMAETTATAAQLDALLACDLTQGTADRCRAFAAVFDLAMDGKPVDAKLLALALAMPTKSATQTR